MNLSGDRGYESWDDEIKAFAVRLQSYGVVVPTHSEDKLEPGEVCPDCGGLGVIKADLSHIPFDERIKHPAFGRLFACTNAGCKAGAEHRARQDKARLGNAGLPDEYANLTFDTWEALPTERKRNKWLGVLACRLLADMGAVCLYDLNKAVGGNGMKIIRQRLGLSDDVNIYEPREIIVLYGTPNMGKTGTAAMTVNARRAAGKRATYTRCLEMLEAISNRFGAEEYPKAEDVLQQFKAEIPFLVIDEAGIKGGTGWKFDQFDTIIRGRAAYHKPTLITTNLTPNEFEAEWGTQAFAIINRQGWWIPMLGAPIRAERQKQAPIMFDLDKTEF